MSGFKPITLKQLNARLGEAGKDAIQADDPLASLVMMHQAFCEDQQALFVLQREALTDLLSQMSAEVEERAKDGSSQSLPVLVDALQATIRATETKSPKRLTRVLIGTVAVMCICTFITGGLVAILVMLVLELV